LLVVGGSQVGVVHRRGWRRAPWAGTLPSLQQRRWKSPTVAPPHGAHALGPGGRPARSRRAGRPLL